MSTMTTATRKRKYPDDPSREVFEAVRSGDAVLLSEVLQGMFNSSERTSALETKMQNETLKVTPLIAAAKNGNVECVKVLLNYKADIESAVEENDDLDFNKSDRCPWALFVALFVAASHGHLDVLSCLIANGADVNARSIYNCTPLMTASRNGLKKVITFLIEHGAKMDLQDKNGETALHHAIGSCDALSCLIRNGADVNVCPNDNCTPLMKASLNGHMNAVSLLVECGANLDQQDKNGDTALHYAVNGNSFKIVHELLSLGASQLYNNKGLTPLLAASNKCLISVVEDLITRPECTKEQRIDALELLGASLSTEKIVDVMRGFLYIKHGMEERFADPSHPLFKQSMEPVEAYQNRMESQTLEELAQIEGDRNAIQMESLIIRERILGTNNPELLGPIRNVAASNKLYNGHSIYTELYRHVMKIAHSCNQPCHLDLFQLTQFLYDKVWSVDPPRQNDVLLELLQQTVLEYEKQRKSRSKSRSDSEHEFECCRMLFGSAMKLVQTIAKFELCDEGKSSCLSELLKRLCFLNPKDEFGDRLLHVAVKRGRIDTVKLLLNKGFNVDDVNSNGDTPLHIVVNHYDIHCWTDILEVLLDGGAHHDFVNHAGLTAMDMAKTDEARMILSEKRKLELKCISARAVQKFGIPYMGVNLPKILEKFVSMH